MRTLRLIYEGPLSTVNARRRMHYQAVGRENRGIREWAGLAARHQWTGGPAETVTIEFVQTTTTRRMPDPDACQGASKPIIDGLVDAGVIPDDTGTHVESITYHAPEHTGTPALICLVKETDT